MIEIKSIEDVIKLINELANIRASNGVTGFDKMVIQSRELLRNIQLENEQLRADVARMNLTEDTLKLFVGFIAIFIKDSTQSCFEQFEPYINELKEASNRLNSAIEAAKKGEQ